LFVPPFIPHQIDTSRSENAEFIFLNLSEEFLDVLPNDSTKNTLFNLAYLRPIITNAYNMKPFISFSRESSGQMEGFLFELIDEYKNYSELSRIYIRTTLARILNLVAREYEQIAPRNDDDLFKKYRDAIQQALSYIDEHYTENIQLKTISKIALMCERSFSYVFKQITGKTFTEYLQYMRIRKAQSLLSNTDNSLLSISLECGFYDTAHFCHCFKKITGTSPGNYRGIQKN
jgi:YesN/AraC family two-component response regulator